MASMATCMQGRLVGDVVANMFTTCRSAGGPAPAVHCLGHRRIQPQGVLVVGWWAGGSVWWRGCGG